MTFRQVVTFTALALLPQLATAAGPGDYVLMPGVTYGEHEIDFKTGRWAKPGEERLSAASIGYGFGATQNWFTEFYMKYERPDSGNTHLDAWEWENKFQLTEPGQYPIDIGFVIEFEHPKNHAEGKELLWGPLFQTELGKIQLNGNALFSRHYGGDTGEPLQLSYQWQAKYRWTKELEFGFQGFGEMGEWTKWDARDQRTHRVGPAIFGKFDFGTRQAIRYNAAWLAGTTSGAPDHTLRLQVEYEY